MSIFTRRHYVWLASVARDQMSKAREADEEFWGKDAWGDTNLEQEITKRAVETLANALETEADGSFDKPRFMHNVFCAHRPR